MDLNFQLPIHDNISLEKEFVFSVISSSDPDSDRITREAISKEHQFSLFPNPVTSVNALEILSHWELVGNFYADLYNPAGELIETVSLGETKKGQTLHFMRSDLNSGIYFVTIRGDGIFEVHKIVIQRE